MSERHPIIAITGSSGAGTTSVTHTFENIFRREGVNAAVIEGDSFHRFNRKEMKQKAAEAERAGNKNFSHFGPENNLFSELESLFGDYAKRGTSSMPCFCAYLPMTLRFLTTILKCLALVLSSCAPMRPTTE